MRLTLSKKENTLKEAILFYLKKLKVKYTLFHFTLTILNEHKNCP